MTDGYVVDSVPDALSGGREERPGTTEWDVWLDRTLTRSRGPILADLGDGTYRVTFVYRADDGTRSVTLFTALTDQGPYGHPMAQIPGTTVWWTELTVEDDTITSYQYGVDAPRCSREEFFALSDEERLTMLTDRAGRLRADPANPDQIRPTATDPSEKLPREHWASVLAMPRSQPTPWMVPRPERSCGVVEETRFEGRHAADARPVWLYRPPDGSPPSGLLVLLDGPVWHQVVPVPMMLDNLIADLRVAPLAVALVGHPAGPGRDVEYRGSGAFADLLADAIVPWAARRCGTDSCPVAVGGLGRGGLAAVHAALTRRDVFSRAIALSGSFWWSPPGDPRPEWLAREIATAPLEPARFHLAAGRLEDHTTAAHGGTTMVSTTRHLAEVLSARGHEVRLQVFPGGHEAVPHRVTLADALSWLFPASRHTSPAAGNGRPSAPLDQRRNPTRDR